MQLLCDVTARVILMLDSYGHMLMSVKIIDLMAMPIGDCLRWRLVRNLPCPLSATVVVKLFLKELDYSV